MARERRGVGWGGKIWGKSAGKKTAKKSLTLHAGEMRKQRGSILRAVRTDEKEQTFLWCGFSRAKNPEELGESRTI